MKKKQGKTLRKCSSNIQLRKSISFRVLKRPPGQIISIPDEIVHDKYPNKQYSENKDLFHIILLHIISQQLLTRTGFHQS